VTDAASTSLTAEVRDAIAFTVGVGVAAAQIAEGWGSDDREHLTS
jgi:hypothetical protein